MIRLRGCVQIKVHAIAAFMIRWIEITDKLSNILVLLIYKLASAIRNGCYNKTTPLRTNSNAMSPRPQFSYTAALLVSI